MKGGEGFALRSPHPDSGKQTCPRANPAPPKPERAEHVHTQEDAYRHIGQAEHAAMVPSIQ